MATDAQAQPFDVNVLFRDPYTKYTDDDKAVLFRGEIFKKSSAMLVGYRPRLVVVHSAGYMMTWKDPLTAPKKVFALKDSAAIAENSPANAFVFMTSDEKVYAFHTKDPKSRVTIMHALSEIRKALAEGTVAEKSTK